VPRAASAVRLTLERLEGRDLPAPLAPTGVAAAGISSSAIALSWNASTDPTVTGYDVYALVWVSGGGGKGGSHPGHYIYNLLATNLTTDADTITGLTAGSVHSYVLTALNSAGQSPYSYAATAETWIAPRLSPDYVQLSSGAEWYIPSGPVNVTAGLTTQVTPYVGGNPLTFSVLSGPSTVSIDPNSGVVTYTPGPSEVGPVSITLEASNSLGAVTQTIPFNVVAADPTLATPTLSVTGTAATYNGQYQQVSATAFGTDGVTPVSGTYEIAYNGSASNYPPYKAGTYQVLVTFTSSDPTYGNATVLTNLTINPAAPAFSNLSSPTIAVGAATIIVSGNIADGTAFPTGDYVIMTLNGVSQETTVAANGNFSSSFATGSLPVGSYTITYAFAGDSNFNAASDGNSTLTVVPLAAPVVTLNPNNQTVSAGDPVTFTAAATGSPTLTVQWQVSTDGGQTFTNITGNASATTTTLSFYASASQNGYKYRAVFTNSAGSAITLFATLTVEE
jgi:hypothetical protein